MDKKPGSRGVVDSIAALRLKRYNEKGAGAKHAKPAPSPATVKLLQAVVDSVKPKKRKKSKKRSRR